MEVFKIDAFILNGYNGDKIHYKNCTNDGYSLKGTLEIISDGYAVKKKDVYSSVETLYAFSDALKSCYNTLNGSAEYKDLFESDFRFTVYMKTNGKAVIKGSFQSRPDLENVLHFEIPTDQTSFLNVINHIDLLKKTLM